METRRLKPEVLLEDWQLRGDRLHGRFYRHKVIADGRYAHTSRILHLDEKAGVAETENTLYSLGAQRKRKWYRDMWHNARGRT